MIFSIAIIIVGISKKSKYMKTVLSAEMGEGVMVQAKTGQSPVSSSSGGDRESDVSRS